jgi:hypothetical protein
MYISPLLLSALIWLLSADCVVVVVAVVLQGPVDTCEVKIADFGLSALVRLDEDGYDAEESGKRKRYTHLKEVR